MKKTCLLSDTKISSIVKSCIWKSVFSTIFFKLLRLLSSNTLINDNLNSLIISSFVDILNNEI